MKRLLILSQLIVVVCVLIVAAGPRKPFIVQIDAGHGGNDPGFVAENGLSEKELVFELSMILSEKLKQIEGVEVRVLRNSDAAIGLKERIEMIEPEVDLLISLHATGFPGPNRRGMTLHTPSEGSHVETSIKVADAFAESMRTLEIPLMSPEQNKFYILRHAPCPAVLISAGTLSNPEDAKLLSTVEYQHDFADRLSDAIGRIAP
jgi:N-acetylmuramoyl-L-alanine amidase